MKTAFSGYSGMPEDVLVLVLVLLEPELKKKKKSIIYSVEEYVSTGMESFHEFS